MGAAPRQDRPRLASRWACGTRPLPRIAPARYKIWMQLGHWKIHHGLGYSSWNIHENNWYTGGILEIFQHPGLGELDFGESILMVKIQIHIHHGLMIWIVRLQESSPNGRMITAIMPDDLWWSYVGYVYSKPNSGKPGSSMTTWWIA